MKDYIVELTKGTSVEFKRGFIAGLTAFAWWKDGSQYVGTGGTKLRDVEKKVVEQAIKEEQGEEV